MVMNDFRDFLAALEAKGELVRIAEEVNPTFEIGGFARLAYGQGELNRVVQHPLGAEDFARLVHPHDHRAPAVQVDTDVLARYLVLHRGFPPLS